MALLHTPQVELGTACPDFNLTSVNKQDQGKKFSLKDFRNNEPLVVMFICNHCPYVKAIEDRLIQLGTDLKKQNINVVAICSNDPKTYADDSFENLSKRYSEKNFSFYYLHDETQEVAHKFGAVCTPDFFVYDKDLRLAYRGRLDDSWKEPSQVTKRELYDATLLLSEGKSAPKEQISSMGCSIKWYK